MAAGVGRKVTLEINSISSSLMLGTTLFRNQGSSGPKVAAQVMYGLITVVAVVESVVALIFRGLLYIINPPHIEKDAKWLDSSVFAIGWSIFDFFANFQCHTLIADEENARIAYREDWLGIPPGSLV